MSTALRLLASLHPAWWLAALLLAWGGWSRVQLLDARGDLAELRAEVAIQAQAAEARARDEEQAAQARQREREREAQRKIDDARTRAADERAVAERMRALADQYRRQATATRDTVCHADRQRTAEGAGLVAEAGQLVVEGRELARVLAARVEGCRP
jgi:hypothetical protein